MTHYNVTITYDIQIDIKHDTKQWHIAPKNKYILQSRTETVHIKKNNMHHVLPAFPEFKFSYKIKTSFMTCNSIIQINI